MKDPIESSEYKATSVVDSDSDKIIAQSESNSATPTNTAPYDASAATPPTLRQDVCYFLAMLFAFMYMMCRCGRMSNGSVGRYFMGWKQLEKQLQVLLV